jgi:hypothetical protein
LFVAVSDGSGVLGDGADETDDALELLELLDGLPLRFADDGVSCVVPLPPRREGDGVRRPKVDEAVGSRYVDRRREST